MKRLTRLWVEYGLSQDESAHGGNVIVFPRWGWAGVMIMVGGWVLAWNRFALVAPVQRFTYIPLWMGLIVALNGLVYKRSGRSPLTHETKSYLTLFPVSAAFGCNLKSRQPGRVIRYNKRFARDSRYCSWASLVKTGDLFGADFCYRELPLELDPFDCVAYDANPMEFHLSDSERFSR